MEDDKTYSMLKLARLCSIWGLIYFGIGIGLFLSEYILYSAFKQITPISFLALMAFAIALVNYHVRQWALKKIGALDEKGRQKNIDQLSGRK